MSASSSSSSSSLGTAQSWAEANNKMPDADGVTRIHVNSVAEEMQMLRDAGIIQDEYEASSLKELLLNRGTNYVAGLDQNIKELDKCKDEAEFWAQYRGDYLDVRDFIKLKTYEEKRDMLKLLSKARVTLIREHILNIWLFNPNMREVLEEQLEAIGLVLYSGPDELETNENRLIQRHKDFACELSNQSN
jgi:hypothetical protein